MTSVPKKVAIKNKKKALKKGVERKALPDTGGIEVRFYRSNEKPYGAFSNLYRRPIQFDGTEYPTSEHAYQAGKALKQDVRDWILNAPSPALAAMAAHGLYTWDIVPNWAQIKFDRMRLVLYAKFTQHEDLRDLLLATGNLRIVEAGTVNNAVNRLWGEVNGEGQNMLGVLLMELRTKLRAKFTTKQKALDFAASGGERSEAKKLSRAKKK